MLQIFDYLDIKNENDWTIKISSAIEEAYNYRPYQKNKDSVISILSINTAKQIANKIEDLNLKFTFKDNIKEFNISDIVLVIQLILQHQTNLEMLYL